jgi:tetratricopeptide (TPR) repeat protein
VFGDSTHPSGVGAFRIAIWPASSRTNGFADVQGSPAGLNHGNSLPLLKGGGRDMRFSVLPVSVITCCAVVASMWVSPAIGKDVDRCLSGTGDQRIAACTRAIASGRLQGNDLAVKYMNRGVAYKDKGELDRATSDLDEAIRLNPNFADAYRNRGITYGNRGEFDRAIADHTEAIRLDPNFAGAFNARGVAYRAKGEFSTARSPTTAKRSGSTRSTPGPTQTAARHIATGARTTAPSSTATRRSGSIPNTSGPM